MANQPITARQLEVLQIIIKFGNEFPYPPTQAEIALRMVPPSTHQSVSLILKRLAREGYITVRKQVPRSIELTSNIEKLAQAGLL